jgi:hypothetical protein
LYRISPARTEFKASSIIWSRHATRSFARLSPDTHLRC